MKDSFVNFFFCLTLNSIMYDSQTCLLLKSKSKIAFLAKPDECDCNIRISKRNFWKN